MGLFSPKAEEDGAQDAAAAAEKAYRESPQGRATSAFDRGDEFFQIEIPHSSVTGFTNATFSAATEGKIRQKLTRTDLLGQIEEAGWRLEHANWVYIQTGQNSRDKFLASGQHIVVTGEVVGIYLFRRDDTRERRGAPAKVLRKAREKMETSVIREDKRMKVRCHACQHVHSVAAGETSFVCPNCGTKLKPKIQESGPQAP